jgi:Protein of unknown function (DUF2490)
MPKIQFKHQPHQIFGQILALSFFCLTTNVQAETIEDGRHWLNFGLAGPLPVDTWSWTLDLRPRWRDEGQNFDQFVASGFVIKQINSQASLGLGVDHVQNHPAKRESFEENRLSSQFLYKFEPFAGIKLQSRTRFELRRREHFDDTAYRLREMLRASWTIPQHPDWSLVLFDELMIHVNNTDWNVRRGIDQNRIFLGVNYKFNEHVSIESGYLNQHVNTRTIDRENHILNSTLRYSF